MGGKRLRDDEEKKVIHVRTIKAYLHSSTHPQSLASPRHRVCALQYERSAYQLRLQAGLVQALQSNSNKTKAANPEQALKRMTSPSSS